MSLQHISQQEPSSHHNFMDYAIQQAYHAQKNNEVPVGAIIIDQQGNILAQAANSMRRDHDPAQHAELKALRHATKKRGGAKLADCTLIVTLEPCPMCAAAISAFRIKRLIFGAYDPKGGGVEHGPRMFDHLPLNVRPEIIGGIKERQNMHILKTFFEKLRSQKS